jgi:radical SAM protein with 4Fe4S-binding SPASM domain
MRRSFHKTRANLAGIGEYCSRRLLRTNATADRFMRLRSRSLSDYYRSFDPGRDLFQKIAIATQTTCNYSCSFCSVNKKDVALPQGRMTDALFHQIVDQLETLRFKGAVALYINNEPLLDDRLTSFVSLVRRKCPESTIYFSTNGSKLTRPLLEALITAGVSYIQLNDYTPKHAVIRKISSWQLSDETMSHLRVRERSFDEQLLNMTGTVPGVPVPKEPLPLFCRYPFKEIYVGHDGRVTLCCYDIGFKETVGDLHHQSLLEIWRGSNLNRVRQKLLALDRSELVCAKCDYKGYPRAIG